MVIIVSKKPLIEDPKVVSLPTVADRTCPLPIDEIPATEVPFPSRRKKNHQKKKRRNLVDNDGGGGVAGEGRPPAKRPKLSKKEKQRRSLNGDPQHQRPEGGEEKHSDPSHRLMPALRASGSAISEVEEKLNKRRGKKM